MRAIFVKLKIKYKNTQILYLFYKNHWKFVVFYYMIYPLGITKLRKDCFTMDKSKLSISILNGITAIVCCIAVAVTGTVITNKIVDNQNKVAEISANASADGSGSASEDVYAGDSSVSVDDGSLVDDGTAIDDGTVVDDGTSADSSVPSTDASGSTSGSASTGSAATSSGKVITATSGLNSTDKAEVLKYYQLVMEKNEKAGKNHNRTMTLTKLDGGEGGVGTFISMFEPIAKAALADNSSEQKELPGKHDIIKASDWKSAKAVNDGTYTTVTINVIEQTDDSYGKSHEGTVGRSIGVLDGVATALAELDGLEADFQNGKLFLHYKNPKITLKVNNKTGELVKGGCSWGYDVYIDIQELAVKFSFVSLTLKNGEGIVNMTATY